jgi:hypothetical protein
LLLFIPNAAAAQVLQVVLLLHWECAAAAPVTLKYKLAAATQLTELALAIISTKSGLTQ